MLFSFQDLDFIFEFLEKQDRRYSDPKARNGKKIKGQKNSSKIFFKKICQKSSTKKNLSKKFVKKNRQKNSPKKSSKQFVIRIRQKNSSKKFAKKFVKTRNPKDTKVTMSSTLFINHFHFLVFRSSARPASGRPA